MFVKRFKPQIIPSVVCFALLCLLVNLGHWQWQRAEYKDELQARYAQADQAQILGVSEAKKLGHDIQGYGVQVEGRFDAVHMFLLDNQPYERHPGFHVFSPLYMEQEIKQDTEQDEWVLVDRGWMPWTPERETPMIAEPLTGRLLLQGQVYFPSDKQIVLKDDDFSQKAGQLAWPLLVQKLDLPAFSEVLGVELAPFVIRLNQDQKVELADQLPRYWPVVTMSSDKHRAYAFQWLAMAFALVILFVVFSIEKVEKKETP